MLVVFTRSLLLVGFAVLSIRLMGKRQVGQLQPFELVIAIMIADLAAVPMESLDVPLWRGVVPMLSMVVLHQLLTLLSLKSQRLRAFFSGTPTVVIRDGRINYAALEKLCFNLNDLLEELRTAGVQSPTEVGTAIMETSGKLSVFPTSVKRPLTPEDMGMQLPYEGVPLTLIIDGKLEPHNLALTGRDEAWLRGVLAERGFPRMGEVLLCYLDTDGRLSIYNYQGDEPSREAAYPAEDVRW